MVNAPVGFQCPDCASVSNPRGTRATSNIQTSRLAGIPTVTRWILLTCVSIFAYGLLTGNADSLASRFGLYPYGVAQGQWERLLTATFLHAGLLHILFNMYALYILGPGLEHQLGSRNYSALYFLSAIGGSTLSFWFSDPQSLAVGASGAIFGLLTATIVIGRSMHRDVSQLIVLLVINVIIGFSGGIDWHAHFGGAITGAVVAGIYVQDSSKVSKQMKSTAVALIFVLLVVAIVIRNQQLISDLNL